MRYFIYWCSPEYQARWNHIELNMVDYQLQTRLGGKEHTDHKGENLILDDLFKNWHEIVEKYKLEGESELLIWPSQTSQFGETDITFARWREKGITVMCTLLEGKPFKTFEKLKRDLI